MWNPTAGLYTRYGDVTRVGDGVDDRLTIMGSGDELTLHFPAAELAGVARDGWRRDYLLLVDGWAKDADANTAFSQTRGAAAVPCDERVSLPQRRTVSG